MTDARNDSGDDGTSATGRRTRRRGVRAQDAVGEALRVVAEAQREASPTNNGGGGTPPEADDHDHQDRVPKRPLPQESLPNPRPAQRPRLDDADDPFASSSHLSSPAPTPPSESSSLSPPPSSRAASPVSPSPDTAPAEGATNQTPRIQENQLDLDLPSAQSSGTRATTPLPDDAPPAPHAAPGGAPDAQGAPADAPQRGRKRRTQENVHPMETRTKRAKREEEQYVMRDSTHAMETRARSNRRAETQRPSDAPRNDEPHRTRRRGR